MEKCIKCGEYGVRAVCLKCHDNKPITSHAVLGEGWRDARKEFPEKRKMVLLYFRIIMDGGTNIFNVQFQGFYNGKHWIDWEYDELSEYGTEVIAWRPLQDQPAFD